MRFYKEIKIFPKMEYYGRMRFYEYGLDFKGRDKIIIDLKKEGFYFVLPATGEFVYAGKTLSDYSMCDAYLNMRDRMIDYAISYMERNKDV